MNLFQTGRVSLKVEAIWSFETSKSLYHTVRCHMPQESWLHTALRCVFLSCMFFDISDLLCGEYRVVFYCPEILSLLTKSDPHTQNTAIIRNLMFSYKTCLILDTLEKLRKAIISFVMSVCPFELNTSACTERIFTKFGFSVFFENLSRKFKFH